MNALYQRFKLLSGLRTGDITKETGYTRQGILYAFDQIELTGKCSKPFEAAMKNLLSKKAQEEADHYQERLKLIYEARGLVDRQKT